MPARILRNALILAAAASSTLALAGCQKPTRAQYDATHGWAVYGNLVETYRDVHPEIVASDVPAWAGVPKRIVLSGTVADVCRTMGCWLEIADDSGARAMVMNLNHAFFIPRNARGRNVHAIGWVVEEEHSVDMLKHLAMDAGKPQAEIDAIAEPAKRLIFIAESVILPSGGLEKPVELLPAEEELPAVDTGMTPAAEPAK